MSSARGSGKLFRILIITYAFPPLNSIASHRPYSWARVWCDEGHTIHVLTLAKYGYDGFSDLQCDMNGIWVHEAPYLGQHGHSSVSSSTEPVKSAHRWEWLKRVTRRIRLGLGMFGDVRLLAYPSMVREGLRIGRDQKIDLIIATAPPEMVFFVARTLSKKLGIPWVADFRDAWFPDLRLYHTKLVGLVAGPINRWLVKTANTCVTVSRGLQQRLSSYLGREVFLVYNGFFEAGRDATPPRRPWNDGKLHIAYTGRIYPRKQDPEPLFRALASLGRLRRDLPHRVSVDFYGFDRPWLHPLIKRHGVEDCVRLCEFVPYRESINVQRAADVLLFLDWTEGQGDGMLTGKLFEYFGSGRPILAIGARKDSEAARLIAETGCGVTLTSDVEIIDYFQNLLVTERSDVVGSLVCDALSRERQARALLDHLNARLFSTGRDGR